MTVFAAGAVCWRVVDGKIKVLLIHRTRHKDISLPKGKLDPGEVLPQTAVREIAEETGLKVALGVPLGVTNYVMPNHREKVVHYWAAEVTEEAVLNSTFVPNNEVAALEWMPVARALASISYKRDAEILKRFQALVDDGLTNTFAIIALRHAKAIPAFDFDGRDSARPLTHRGELEARSIVAGLSAFGPTVIRSSTALRCQQTVAPTADALGITLKKTDSIAQDAFENGTSDIRGQVGKRVRRRVTSILCSHGPVLPEIMREVALATGSTKLASISRAGDLPVAGYTVIHLSRDRPGAGIIAIETHVPR
ncbi:DNA mismatch repair protein MutT [Agreia sp. Leaf244]|uniref:NUDIX hydrolase n=1 Tax=Agreia sp. Leaf244 TaxID=1736305 RepID=UPI0006F57F1B|nr:NUDIX domain-containing protein [Agreia sp. Leaf244]KQO09681.1 DNA mismatch repair protein MutT [Agreia sp. Leaf244]